MANGKQKGSNFEREICRSLSEWVSNGKEADCFWRSAMSGGRATVGKKKGGKGFDNCAGDITCTGATGRELVELFVIECKFYKDLNLSGFLFGKEPKMISDWLEKLLAECGGKREPLLIAKQNFQPEVCFTTLTGLRILQVAGRLLCTGRVYHRRVMPFAVFPFESLKRLDYAKMKGKV